VPVITFQRHCIDNQSIDILRILSRFGEKILQSANLKMKIYGSFKAVDSAIAYHA
jgi:hypothetical protein